MKTFRASVLTLAVAALAAPGLAQTKVPVYVFTATDPSGLVDSAQQARLDTVKALREDLRKSKTITPVDTAEAATVQIEIQGTKEVIGVDGLTLAANALNPHRTPQDNKTTIPLRVAQLSVGTYDTTLTSQLRGGRGSTYLADIIEKWVKNNRAQLEKATAPEVH